MEIAKFKFFIQSSNINFLFGSGLSRPYLTTLGDIEKWLTELANDNNLPQNIKQVLKASIYREYFTKVILPNQTKTLEKDYDEVINGYKAFLNVWNEIINKRANHLLTKQVNIYTTNIDTLVENASEKVQIEFNDGFKGSICQIFDEGNFQKSYSKTSLHFQNVSEIPVFNLLKMHGSINWNSDGNIITNDYNLSNVLKTNTELKKIDSDFFVDCTKRNDEGIEISKSYLDLKAEASELISRSKKRKFGELYKNLFLGYDKLTIVNPTKQKFVESVTELHFYELMRMYSNSLEKETSLLFVMGFSFADEHIAKITLRAAKTNPTLIVVIFAYDDDQEAYYNKILKPIPNNNILIITPTKFKNANKLEKSESVKTAGIEKFDLTTINLVFDLINSEIQMTYGK